MDNVINLLEYVKGQREAEEAAQLEMAIQEVRNTVVRQRQNGILITLHAILNSERELGLLTESELIEIVNIFSTQVIEGLTIK